MTENIVVFILEKGNASIKLQSYFFKVGCIFD